MPIVSEVLDHGAMATTQATAPRGGFCEQVELGSRIPIHGLPITTFGHGFVCRSFDQTLPSGRIRGGMEQDAFRGETVSSRSPRLLLVVL